MEITKFSQLKINKLYTYTDYLSWKFEERVELIKGKVFKMAEPSSGHQKIAGGLTSEIYTFFKNKPCEVYPAPFDVRLPIPKGDKAYTVVQPDLCVICDESKIDKRGAKGAPDLAIEIVSPGNSKRDLKDKFEIYQEAGIKEYWIVHPEEKHISIFCLSKEGKYIGLQPITEDDKIKSALFPDLQFEAKDIFFLKA